MHHWQGSLSARMPTWLFLPRFDPRSFQLLLYFHAIWSVFTQNWVLSRILSHSLMHFFSFSVVRPQGSLMIFVEIPSFWVSKGSLDVGERGLGRSPLWCEVFLLIFWQLFVASRPLRALLYSHELLLSRGLRRIDNRYQVRRPLHFLNLLSFFALNLFVDYHINV